MCFPKIHAEPERVHTASQTNTHNTPQTGGQVHTHATPTEEVRLAFCCYCNSVIPRCPRPNGGQGAGFCCVCTLCGLSLSYTGEWLFACLSTLHLVPHCLPTATGHRGCPLAAKLPSQIHYGNTVSPQEFYHRQGMFTHATSAPKQASQLPKHKSKLAEGRIFDPRWWRRHCDKGHQRLIIKPVSARAHVINLQSLHANAHIPSTQ